MKLSIIVIICMSLVCMTQSQSIVYSRMLAMTKPSVQANINPADVMQCVTDLGTIVKAVSTMIANKAPDVNDIIAVVNGIRAAWTSCGKVVPHAKLNSAKSCPCMDAINAMVAELHSAYGEFSKGNMDIAGYWIPGAHRIAGMAMDVKNNCVPHTG